MNAPNLAVIQEVFADLVAEPRWVCWRYEERKGRQTKVPLQPGGRSARVDKPGTWSILARCLAYADASPGVEGVGIVFNGDGLIGVDLDGCLDPDTGEPNATAAAIVADHGSYTERTPSGRGLHIICRGTLPGGSTGTRRGDVEVYANGRFFTTSGDHLSGTPDEIVDATQPLERLWVRLGAHIRLATANGAGDGASEAYQAAVGPDTPWRRLNTAALGKLGSWVPGLFGDAAKFARGTGGYRIGAADLGRDLEEDLSIMPHGIRDFGMGDLGPDGRDGGREGRRTPIDLVLEFGGAPDEMRAAAWLADRMGKKLEEFGFDKPRRANSHATAPDKEAARWNDQLHRTDRGEVRDVLHNAALILRLDARLARRLRWNLMLEAVEGHDLPWRRDGAWREWTDGDDLQFANWCQQRHAYLKPRTCGTAVQVVARDHAVHPLRERLNALTWDGTPRLDGWLFEYLGASAERRPDEGQEAHEARVRYLEEVGRRWMISAVARVMRPGCKADCALILEGVQGAMKSTTAETLALEPEWFADAIADLGTKDSAQDLRGKWVHELGELSAMRRGEVERVKAFMSRRIDHYRPSYGTRSQDFPRQCVFIGTTNGDAYLADETGGRRWWPVKVGTIDVEGLARDRDQLWAEAVAAHRRGEKWWLEADVEQAARAEQDERRISDPWEPHVLTWLADKAAASVDGILEHAIGMPKERQDQRAMNRVAYVLKSSGWKLVQRRVRGRPTRFYERPANHTRDSDPYTRDSDSPTRDGMPEKPSVSVSVTGVTGVTGKFPSHTDARPHTRLHTRAVVLSNGCDTRDTRDAPPWTDTPAWFDRLKAAPGDEVRSEILHWGRAAGGIVVDGDRPTVTLPKHLPKGPPLDALRQFAHGAGVEVRQP